MTDTHRRLRFGVTPYPEDDFVQNGKISPSSFAWCDMVEDDEIYDHRARTSTSLNQGDNKRPDHPRCMLMRDWSVQLIEPVTTHKPRRRKRA